MPRSGATEPVRLENGNRRGCLPGSPSPRRDGERDGRDLGVWHVGDLPHCGDPAYIRQQDKDRDRDWQVKTRTRTGIPVAFVDMQIVNEEGEAVRTDDKESGELLIRAPWLTQGYVKDPEKGAELWKGGWLHTGDVATIDAQQAIKIADRIKDVIKSGENGSPPLTWRNPHRAARKGIAETAVVGMPDAKWGERPYALVVARPGYTLTIDQVREHIRTFIQKGQISKWAMPEQIEFVDVIPKTSVGKIDKKKIRANIRLCVITALSGEVVEAQELSKDRRHPYPSISARCS